MAGAKSTHANRMIKIIPNALANAPAVNEKASKKTMISTIMTAKKIFSLSSEDNCCKYALAPDIAGFVTPAVFDPTPVINPPSILPRSTILQNAVLNMESDETGAGAVEADAVEVMIIVTLTREYITAIILVSSHYYYALVSLYCFLTTTPKDFPLRFSSHDTLYKVPPNCLLRSLRHVLTLLCDLLRTKHSIFVHTHCISSPVAKQHTSFLFR